MIKRFCLNELVTKCKEKNERLIDYSCNIPIRSREEEIPNIKDFLEEFEIPELKSILNYSKYDLYYSKYNLKKKGEDKCLIF